MEKRRLGRTGHESAVAIFGSAAFWSVGQAEADAAMEQVIAAGVNHIDVAPSYGLAEERLGPGLARERDRFFLGCKTTERTREGAAAELRRSLERLQVSSFDLYQMHAVNTPEELDLVTGSGGSLEAARDAREAGLTRFIGITGHGHLAPGLYRRALDRFDFDTVLFPVNATLYANPEYRRDAEALIAECRARDVGIMVIKALAKEPWRDHPKRYNTWYEPYDETGAIQRAVDFALSQDVTGLCTPGDLSILPKVLEACAHCHELSAADREAMIRSASPADTIFA